MPMYEWRCPECGAELSVIHTFDEGAEPPTVAEVAAAKIPACHSVGGHQWTKVYGAVVVARGPNWGDGSKGNWMRRGEEDDA